MIAGVLGIINSIVNLLLSLVFVVLGTGLFGSLDGMRTFFLIFGLAFVVLSVVNFIVSSQATTEKWACYVQLGLGLLGLGILNIIGAILSFREDGFEGSFLDRLEDKRRYRRSLSSGYKARFFLYRLRCIFVQLFYTLLTVFHNILLMAVLFSWGWDSGFFGAYVEPELVFPLCILLYLGSAILFYFLKGGTLFFSNTETYYNMTNTYSWETPWLSDSGRWTQTGSKTKSRTSTIYVPNPLFFVYLLLGTLSTFTHLIGLILMIFLQPGGSIFPCNNIYKRLPAEHKNGWFVSGITSFMFGFVFTEKAY